MSSRNHAFSNETPQIYLYALAAAAQKYGVLGHGFACPSNHPHEKVTDVLGVLPDFLRDLRREIALATKELYQIPDNLWAAQSSSCVELHGEDAQLQAMRYILLNPVEAGLVPRAAHWPGSISLPGTRSIEVRRPDVWFSKDRPETLTLHIVPPPSWEGSEDAWHAWLAEEVAAGEDEIGLERRKARKPFLGRDRVLAQDPFDRPRNPDALVAKRNPTLKTVGRALMQAVIAELRVWRRAYYVARERWCTDKAEPFPMGTWWVVQRAGAALA